MNEEPLPPWQHRARRIAIRCAFVLGAFLVLWILGAPLAILIQGAVCLLLIYVIIKSVLNPG